MVLSAWRVQIRPEVSFARNLLRAFSKWAAGIQTEKRQIQNEGRHQTRCVRVVNGRLRAKKVDEKVDTMSTLLTLCFDRRSERAVGGATQKGDERNPWLAQRSVGLGGSKMRERALGDKSMFERGRIKRRKTLPELTGAPFATSECLF